MHKNTPDIKNHINSQYDESYDRVKYLKDQYKGETAYILGTGPSINKIPSKDLNKLKDKLDLPSWWYSSKILPRGELWCDSSGFGASDEPALNTLQLIKVISRLFKNKPGLGFGLYSTGQFQVGVRVFDVA